jgi:hypothetical protein
MEREEREIEGIAWRLVDSPEPISFLDVVMLLRRSRQVGAPVNDELVALVALHDAPHTTDGARGILGEYLSGWAKRQQTQRDLGARTVLKRDSGKTARVAAGSSVRVELEERRGAGYRWEVKEISGPGSCEPVVEAGADLARAVFTMKAPQPGTVRVILEERPPPGQPTRDDQAAERFVLTLEVEP